MIYGYDSRELSDSGLKEMREVSFAVSPETLRALAEFFITSASELEQASSPHSHRHLPESLRQEVGCDVVLLKRYDDSTATAD